MAKEPWSMEPKGVREVLSEDTYDDCTACRVTGRSTTCVNGVDTMG